MKQTSKIYIIIVLFVATAIYSFFYGFTYPPCAFTEEEIDFADTYKTVTLTLVKDVEVLNGVNPNFSKPNCTRSLHSISREILPSLSAYGRTYYLDRGRSSAVLKAGFELKAIRVISVTSHGFQNLDKGPGPIKYLVLMDQNNNYYTVSTPSLGSNSVDGIIGYKDEEGSLKYITYQSF